MHAEPVCSTTELHPRPQTLCAVFKVHLTPTSLIFMHTLGHGSYAEAQALRPPTERQWGSVVRTWPFCVSLHKLLNLLHPLPRLQNGLMTMTPVPWAAVTEPKVQRAHDPPLTLGERAENGSRFVLTVSDHVSTSSLSS